jgi:hypothetical protein
MNMTIRNFTSEQQDKASCCANWKCFKAVKASQGKSRLEIPYIHKDSCVLVATILYFAGIHPYFPQLTQNSRECYEILKVSLGNI